MVRKKKRPRQRKQPKPYNINEDVFIFRTVKGKKRVHRIRAPSFELAKEKAILQFSHIIYFKPKPMDLVTAHKRAAKASLDSKRPHYVIVDGGGDGECSVMTAPLRGAMFKYVLGKKDEHFKGSSEEQEKPKTHKLPAQSEKAKKLISAKAAKESAEEDSIEKENPKTKNKMEKSKGKSAKKVAPKKSAKPAKKVAGKKASGPADWGKKVTMTNAEMTAKIKKGYVYRNSKGQNKTNYIPERPNQELVNVDYYESKPE